MTNHQLRKHIGNKNTEKSDHKKFLSYILGLHSKHPMKESTINEIRAKVSSAIAQCDISIRDHEKLITIIKCHCDDDDRENCYADCDYVSS